MNLGHPTEAYGRIPAFQNIEEEAAFWDTHDFTDFLDQFEPVEVTFVKGFRSTFNFILELAYADWDEIRSIAEDRDTDYHDLIRMWIGERLSQERKAS